MTIQHWLVSSMNLTRVVKNDNLGNERFGFFGRIRFAVRCDITTLDILDGHVLDIESNSIMMHFNRFNFSGDISRSKTNDHTSLDYTSLHTTYWNSSNTTNLVNILKWESEWLVIWSNWRCNVVDSLLKRKSCFLSIGTLGSPSFVPFHFVRWFNHVISMPSRDRNKSNSFRLVANFLYISFNFFLDFIKSSLAVWRISVVYLVDANNHLLHT